MIIGGFTSAVFGGKTDNLEENDNLEFRKLNGGGYQNRRTWMYNTNRWIETAESSVARDRPSCSLVNMPNGKVDYFIMPN